MYVYIYVCMYVYIVHTLVYICMYYKYMYAYFVCTHVCMYVFINVCVCMYVFTRFFSQAIRAQPMVYLQLLGVEYLLESLKHFSPKVHTYIHSYIHSKHIQSFICLYILIITHPWMNIYNNGSHLVYAFPTWVRSALPQWRARSASTPRLSPQ